MAGLMPSVPKLPAPATAWDPTDPESQIAKVISSGGKLMDLARTEGAKQTNARGLLNSSLTSAAAQAEVLKAATPIGLQAAQNALSAREAASERALTVQQAQAERDLKKQQAERDRQTQIELAKWNLDAADKERAAAMVQNIAQLYESSYQTIMSNKDLSATARKNALNALQARTEARNAATRELFDVDISFGGTKAAPSTSGSTSKPPVKKPATPATPAPTKAATESRGGIQYYKGTKVPVGNLGRVPAGWRNGTVAVVGGRSARAVDGYWVPA